MKTSGKKIFDECTITPCTMTRVVTSLAARTVSTVRAVTVRASSDNKNTKKQKPTDFVRDRVDRDVKRLNTAFERLNSSRKAKRDDLAAELKTTVRHVDRIAREEIEALKIAFDDADSNATDDDDFDIIDDVVVFRD